MPTIDMGNLIKYSSEYGTTPSSKNLNYSTQDNLHIFTEDELPILTADGVTFIGWYTTPTFDNGTMISVGDKISASASITLYAKWEIADEVVFVNESSLRNIANAIRNKTGNSNTYQPSQMAGAIEGISVGVDLPTLTNPASETEVFEGREIIDGEGNKKVGTFTIDNEVITQTDLITQIATALQTKASANINLPELSNPASSDKILNGYEAIDGEGNLVIGSMPTTKVDYSECVVDENTGMISPLIMFNQGGYVPDGYEFASNYIQLPTQAATTITPTSSEQVAVAAGTYCTGEIKVGAASGGGGGSVETCTVNYVVDAPTMNQPTIYYTNSSLSATLIQSSTMGISFQVAKNTIIYFDTGWSAMSTVSGGATLIGYALERAAFVITGNCTLTYGG